MFAEVAWRLSCIGQVNARRGTGDEFLDLFILERAPQKGSLVDYQALKIINGDPFFTTEIFETTLLVESGDGTEFGELVGEVRGEAETRHSRWSISKSYHIRQVADDFFS